MRTAPGVSRIPWVDAGRGIAILLVVVLHTTNWLAEAGFDVEAVRAFNATVASLRLPLFFTLAGMFAVKWMTASWRDLWRSKLSLLAWVYLVWSVIATFSFMLGLNLQGAHGNYLAQLRDLLWAPALPRFELWFVWALVIFFVAARAGSRLPPTVQLTAAAALAIPALSGMLAGNVGWVGAAKYFFFFLLGLLLRERLVQWGERRQPLVATAAVVLWAALAIAGATFELAEVPGYYFVTCAAGVLAGVVMSRVLVVVPGLRYLGGRTLPIYLTHTSFVLVVVWSIWRFGAPPERTPAALALILVVIVAAAAIAASLFLARCVRTAPLMRLLYVQPRWFAVGAEPVTVFPARRASDPGNRDVA